MENNAEKECEKFVDILSHEKNNVKKTTETNWEVVCFSVIIWILFGAAFAYAAEQIYLRMVVKSDRVENILMLCCCVLYMVIVLICGVCWWYVEIYKKSNRQNLLGDITLASVSILEGAYICMYFCSAWAAGHEVLTGAIFMGIAIGICSIYEVAFFCRWGNTPRENAIEKLEEELDKKKYSLGQVQLLREVCQEKIKEAQEKEEKFNGCIIVLLSAPFKAITALICIEKIYENVVKGGQDSIMGFVFLYTLVSLLVNLVQNAISSFSSGDGKKNYEDLNKCLLKKEWSVTEQANSAK